MYSNESILILSSVTSLHRTMNEIKERIEKLQEALDVMKEEGVTLNISSFDDSASETSESNSAVTV